MANPKKGPFSLVLLSLLGILLTNCDVGIGSQVDVARPSAALESHEPGDYLRGTVTLRGTATDDIGVVGVEVSVNGGISFVAVPTETLILRGKTAEWAYDLDTRTIPDGPISVVVNATDGSGRIAQTDTLVFNIDNTPPVLVVSSPRNYESIILNTQGVLTLEVSDISPLTSYGIQVWSAVPDTPEQTANSSSLVWNLISPEYAPKIIERSGSPFVYTFSSLPFTQDLVTPRKFFRFALWATDRAGNTSTSFYHGDEIYPLNENQALSAVELSQILGGQPKILSDGSVLQANDLTSVAQQADGNSRFILLFDEEFDIPKIGLSYPSVSSLGPEQWPTVSSSDVLQGYFQDDDGIDLNTMTISVDRLVNGDGSQSSDWSEVVDSVPISNYQLNSEIGNRRVDWQYSVVGLPLPNQGRFRLRTQVHDVNGTLSVLFSQNLIVSDGKPSVSIEPPLSGFLSDTLTIEGNASHAVPLDGVQILIGYGSSVSPTWVYDSSDDLWAQYDHDTTKWTFNFPIPDLPVVPEGTVIVEARAMVGSEFESRQVTFVRDTQAPNGSFLSPASGSYLNEIAEITGFADDNRSGVEKLEFRVGAPGTWWGFNSEVGGPSLGVEGYEFEGTLSNFVFKFDSTNFVDDTLYPIWLRVTDRAGNQYEVNRSYRIFQDSDLPELDLLNVDASSSAVENILSGVPARILGTALDDDGFLDGTGQVVSGVLQYRIRSFDLSENPGAWSSWRNVPSPIPNGSKEVSFSLSLVHPDTLLSLGDGIHEVQMWVQDKNGIGLTRGVQETGGIVIPFAIDNGPPTLSFLPPTPVPGASVPDSLPFGLSASDALGLQSVQVQVEGPSTPSPLVLFTAGPDRVASQTFTNSLESLNSGTYTLTATATDLAGSTGSINRTLIVDRDIPSATITTPEMGAKVNGIVTLRGGANDIQRVDRVHYTLLPVGQNPPLDKITWDVADGSYSWSIEWDTTAVNDGDEYILHVSSQDPAGNWSPTVSRSFQVDQSSDLPQASFTDLDPGINEASAAGVGGVNLLDFGPRVRGTLIDDDRIDAGSMQIRVNSTLSGDWQSLSGPVGPSGLSVNFTHNLGLTEGIHYFYLRFSDDASVKSGRPVATTTLGPIYFAIDTAPPVISFTSPIPGSYQGSAFELRGTATDGNGLQPEILVRTPADSSWADATTVTLGGDGTWVATIDDLFTGAWEGPRTIQVQGTDIFEKSTIGTLSVVVDTLSPEVTIENPALDGWLQGISGSVVGQASDTGVVGNVYYWIGDRGVTPPAERASWSTASGTTSWNGTFNMVELGEGLKTLHVQAVDGAGNVSPLVTRDYGVDQNSPEVTETTISSPSAARSNLFSLGGTFSDSNSIYRLRISQQKGAGDFVTIYDSSSFSGVSSSWSLSDLPRDPDAPDPTLSTSALLADGVYSYLIHGEDVAGKVQSVSRVITVDLTGPSVTINQPGDGAVVNGTSLAISGTSNDPEDVSPITEVRYWVGNSVQSPPVSYADWSLASGGASWTGVLDLQALGEGNKILRMVARDSAGNWSPGPSQRAFVLDQNVPSITEELLGATGPTLFRNGPFSLGGSVSDTNGLTQVEVLQGASLVATLPVSGTTSAWQIDNLPDGVGTDGSYTYTLRVTDAAGRTSSINRSLTFDTTDPSVTLGSFSPIVGVDRVNGQINGTATASDLNGIQEIRWWFLPQTDLQPNFDTPTGTAMPQGNSSIAIDTTNYLDGNYRLWVIAKDQAENFGITTRDYVVDQESDAPVFGFGFSAGAIYNDTPFTLGGTVADDDGISSIEWRVSGILEWTPLAQWTENFPLTTNWSITIDSLADGVGRTIELRAIDSVGATTFATTTTSSPAFSLLTQSPIIEIDSPVSGFSINGENDIGLSGSAYVDTNVFVQKLEYQLDNDGWVSFYTGTPTGPVGYSTLILKDVLVGKSDGILRLRIRATGTNDKTSIETVEIRIDKTNPEVAFSIPAAGSTVNGTIRIAGTANDVNVVDRVRLEVIRVSNGSIIQTYEDLGRFTWELSGMLDTLALQDNEPYLLRATAFDGAGNSQVVARTIQINQASDTPVLTYSNLNPDGSTLFVGNGNILGTANDDDGVDRLEYRFNSGSWVTIDLGGTTQENFSIPYSALPEGTNTLEIRAYDTVGLVAGTYFGGSIDFGIDRLAPEVSFLGPLADSFQTSPFSLNGIATDANGIAGVEYRVGDSGVFAPIDEYVPGTGAWNHEVIYSGSDGNARVYIQVTDWAGRVTTVSRQFAFDTTPPTLSFLGPGESGFVTVNRDIEIFGTSTDIGSGVQLVELFGVHPGDGNLASLGTVNGTGTWSLNFDTTRVSEVGGDLYGYAAETSVGSKVWNLTLRAVAGDATGNSGSLDRIIQIDQTTNRPVLEFSNFVPDGSAIFDSRVNILGTVTDDEGVDFFQYRFNGGSWTTVELGDGPTHGISIPLTSLPDGPSTLEVIVQDIEGGIESARTLGPVGFVLDTTPPLLSFLSPGSNSYENDDVLVRVAASDANGITEIRGRIGSSGAWTIGSDQGDGTFTLNLDTTGLDQGLHTIFVEAEDASGLLGRVTQASRDFTYDSVLPIISVLNPESGANVNGQISILGTAQDESGILGTQYRIGNQGDLNDGWISFANRLNWNTGNILINQFGTSEYGIEITPNVWEVPLLIRTTDNAGNLTLLTSYFLEIDPDGDRPFVQILQPGDGDTVGGRVRLSGTSQDDDAVYSVQVAFDMNNDGSFVGSGDLWPSPAAGWDPGQEPLVGQTDTETTGWYTVEAATADWSNWYINLNTYSEFDPEPGQTRQISIKVRSIDTKDGTNPGIPGNPVTLGLTFDSNAPRIENMNYQTGDTVGGQIVFRGLLKDPTGLESFRWIRGTSSTFLVNNGTILVPGQIALVNPGDPDFEAGISTYRFAIPVDTTTITASGPGFFTFEAAKGNYISQVYVNLQIDNLVPTGSFTSPETIDVAGSSFALLSGTNYTLQGTANDSGSVSGVRSVAVFLEDENGDYYDLRTNLYGGSRGPALAPLLASEIIAGQTYLIVNPGTTDFLALGALRNTRGMVFTATESGSVGSGSGTVLPSSYFALIDTFNEEGQDLVENKGDQDGFKENLSLSGGTVNWYWQFDSNLLNDGPVTIHYETVDRGFNTSSSSVNGFVANNRPVIDSIVLGTDVGGDGLTNGTGERVEFFGAYGATHFTLRNGVFFYEVRGTSGNGTQTYTLEYWNGSAYLPLNSTTNSDGLLTDFVTPGITDTIINGSEPPNGAQFRIQVTDSLGLSSAAVIGLNIDNIDSISPTSRLFQLTADDRAIDGLGRYLGHVEPWNQSPFDNMDLGFDKVNEILGNDADVSGSVIFRGEAWDNQRLDSLWISVEVNPGVTTSEQIAEADPSTGILVPLSNSLGSLEIDSQSLTQNQGHSVEFGFQWNSATIAGVARANVGIEIVSRDAGLNDSTVQPLLNALQVDVVPYISKVSTAHRPNVGGLKDFNIRTTDGRYTLASGSTTDFIRVTGFNLNPIANGVRVSPVSFPEGVDGTNLVGESLAFSNLAGDFTSVDVSNAATGSGYLSIVGGTLAEPVSSLNNSNRNDLSHNIEEDLVVTRNRLRTDDRFLQFYGTATTGINSATYPNMIMDGDTPVWGYIQSGAANDQMVRRGTTGALNTPLTRILAGDQLAMTRDEGGRYHMISVNNFSQGRILYFNDEFAAVSGDGAFTSPYWSGHSGVNTSATGNNAIQLESVNQAPGLKLGRYVRPVIRSIGNSSAVGEHAKLFMLYFDNASNQLLFRNWQVGQTVTNQAQNLSGTYRSNLRESNTDGRQVLSNSASEHFTMAVTDAGIVVVGYYDQAVSQFVIRYSTTTANGTVAGAPSADNPATLVNWSAPILVPELYIGWYPSMTIDPNGRIHIAAYDSSTASLGYILMDSFDDSTPEVVTVDTFNSVGYYTDIQIGPDGLPWIGYYNVSETGTRDALRVARYLGTPGTALEGVDSQDFVTGNWEVETVPVASVPNGANSSFLRVNLGFTTAGVPILGYAGTGLEYSQPLPVIQP